MGREKTLLRLLSCGSVDDGKSTLIGRILYDCGTLYEDQLTLLAKETTSEGLPDFSCLLDGLLAEREQAITIDAAYRSFSTATRRYLVADAPGHEQYTRNMVTAASHADAALILIDALRVTGELLPQTKRHSCICSMLGITDIVFAVNKMDRCAYSEQVFRSIEDKCRALVAPLGFRNVFCVPVSALRGDTVCSRSAHMPWYTGPTLFEILEGLEPPTRTEQPFRMPVQWVARSTDFRGLSGTIIAGSVAAGSPVLAQPSGVYSRIKAITTFDGSPTTAGAEDAVCLTLEDDLDIGRGEILVSPEAPLETADHFAARIVWLDETELQNGRTYIFRLATAEAQATLTEISSALNLQSMEEIPAKSLKVNDIGMVKLSLDRPLPFAPFKESPDLGGFILVDRISGNTLGAGMIEFALRRSHNIFRHDFTLDKRAYAAQKNQTARTLWFTGLSASGKSSLADLVAKSLFAAGKHVYILDGDNLRQGLNRDLGFAERDRVENIRRASEVARILTDAGLIVLGTFISPYRADRLAIRDRFNPGEFFEIFVDTPLEECIRRDPKGLYKKALAGHIPNFTGISAPFEAPENPDLHLNGTKPLEALLQDVLRFWESLK